MDRIKGPWSPEEDQALRTLVNTHGPRNCSVISKSIPGRSGKSCQLRWCNQLSSGSDLSDSGLPAASVYKPLAVNIGPGSGPIRLEAQEMTLSWEKQLFSQEFLKVMQEMIRVEVKNYMSGLESNAVCEQTDSIRNAVIKRMGIGRVE